MNHDLTGLRGKIDEIDDEIVDLLGRRFELLREVAAHKRPRGIPVVIPARIDEVVERCVARGARHGLDGQMLRDLYHRIIDEACRAETRLMTGPGHPIPAVGDHD